MNRVEADELIERLAAERERLEAQVVALTEENGRLRARIEEVPMLQMVADTMRDGYATLAVKALRLQRERDELRRIVAAQGLVVDCLGDRLAAHGESK